ESLGGWRLWVKDRRGNRFYYAHLSAYTSLARNGTRVHAGDVLGFMGNTGDAITTPYHLHFEIHPRSLRRLGYDGAVDPTSYLDGWLSVASVKAPAPVLDPPGGPPAPEQRVVARKELLAVAQGGIHAESFLGKLPKIHIGTPPDGPVPPAVLPARSTLRSGAHAIAEEIGSRSGFSATSIAFALLALLTAGGSVLLRVIGPRRALTALTVLSSRFR
ncbi:MAG: M23 family metallopeptidase, partial [Gaiellaceae bacterium]